MTGLPNSSKDQDMDFLVITGNWRDPLFNCPLTPRKPDKEFTEKKVEFVEWKTVEHLLKNPCFVDCRGFSRSGPISLEYVPSYNSFQDVPRVKDLRQVEVTVSQPGKSNEAIIEADSISKRKIPVPLLVTPLTNPHFVPSVSSSDIGLREIRFPSLFDPTPKTPKEMSIQKRTISLGSMLEKSNPPPTNDALPLLSPPPGFIQGEKKIVKRKRVEEDEGQGAKEQQLVAPAEPLKSPIPASKGKSKDDRSICKDSVMKNKDGHGGLVANAVGKSLLLPKDMKSWQKNKSEHLIKNLKRPSVLRLLKEALGGNALLKELEKTAFTRIQAAESQHKSPEAGLMSTKRQVRELQKKRNFKKAEDTGQAYYDQGFDEETASLKSQLGKKYNLCFLQAPTEEIKETPVDDPQNLEQVQVEDVNEGEDEDDDEEDDEVEDVTNRLTDANA
uniref:Uncharacterized protein n=1 Tax=Fagus sylvatica TaxID=28930 RepID=A0A2N9F0Y2_FAGSY